MQTFATALGELNNFTFAQLDTQGGEVQVAQTRPRTVERPRETPTPQPTETPAPEPVPSPTPTETPTPDVSPTATPSPTVAETPTPSPSATENPPAESPAPVPIASPEATPVETPATPIESPQPSPSPSAAETVARNVRTNPARPTRTPAAPANPEDEKEEVEITLTKPMSERIQLLKAFIAAHPKSVAVPRANELIVVTHATLGDQKLEAGDVRGGLEEFRRALAAAPSEVTDRFFTEVIARIPMNLFVRGQREAAISVARQAEGLAKLNPNRLLAVAQFYLAIEDASEANRLAELTVQTAPDLGAAHQALGAARHIALRLDDAETEYARAIALDPKALRAKLALADLQRGAGKTEAALALYREVAAADPKNNSAFAGIILSQLELGQRAEADQELNKALQDPEKSRYLPLLVGAAYWFMAHDNAARALELTQRAVAIEPRYSWAQIAAARALVADKRPLDAERSLRVARQYGRFPTLDYELAGVLASVGLYDEAVAELSKSFTLKDGQIEPKLAGRTAARAKASPNCWLPNAAPHFFKARPQTVKRTQKC